MSEKKSETQPVLTEGEPNTTPMVWRWKHNLGPTQPATLFLSCACGRQQSMADPKDAKDCLCGFPISKAKLKDMTERPQYQVK